MATNKYEIDISYTEGNLNAYLVKIIEKSNKLESSSEILHICDQIENIKIEFAMTYINSYQENLSGYVNNILTIDGGTHLTGLKTILTRKINQFAREFQILKDSEANLSGTDVREGMVAILSIKIPDHQILGKNMTKLVNPEIDSLVQKIVGQPLEDWLINNQRMGKEIVQKALLSSKARNAARKAVEMIRRSEKSKSRLHGKLVRSRTNDPRQRELYILTGLLGSTAVKSRDPMFQEILSIGPRLLEVDKAPENQVLENSEVKNILKAIGAGFKDDFEINNCQYAKVILFTKPDEDGAYIATLLINLFYNYMKPLIEGGYLYMVRPPLYTVETSRFNRTHLYKKEDLKALLDGFDLMGLSRKEYKIINFNLDEINSDQFSEFVMNPNTRKLGKLMINEKKGGDKWYIQI